MAGTTEDKLQLLENTKAGLKTAINATGHTVGEVFSAYPAAVTAYKDEVDAGYAQIAAAITDKGVPTEATDTPAQMAANIGEIAGEDVYLKYFDENQYAEAIDYQKNTSGMITQGGVFALLGIDASGTTGIPGPSIVIVIPCGYTQTNNVSCEFPAAATNYMGKIYSQNNKIIFSMENSAFSVEFDPNNGIATQTGGDGLFGQAYFLGYYAVKLKGM